MEGGREGGREGGKRGFSPQGDGRRHNNLEDSLHMKATFGEGCESSLSFPPSLPPSLSPPFPLTQSLFSVAPDNRPVTAAPARAANMPTAATYIAAWREGGRKTGREGGREGEREGRMVRRQVGERKSRRWRKTGMLCVKASLPPTLPPYLPIHRLCPRVRHGPASPRRHHRRQRRAF